jgi:hypothetical protein
VFLGGKNILCETWASASQIFLNKALGQFGRLCICQVRGYSGLGRMDYCTLGVEDKGWVKAKAQGSFASFLCLALRIWRRVLHSLIFENILPKGDTTHLVKSSLANCLGASVYSFIKWK